MDAVDYWTLFMETGVPEYYLAFQAMKRSEERNVPQNTGTGAPPDGVQ